MFLLKFWYVLCFLVLSTGMYHFYLSQDFSVNFKKSDAKSPFRFSVCFRTSEYLDEESRRGFVIPSKLLKKVYRGLRKAFDARKSEFLFDLKENKTYEKEVRKVNSKFSNLGAKIESSFEEIRRNLEKDFKQNGSFENLIKENNSYWKNELACYLTDHRLLHYLRILRMHYRLYAYSSKPSFYMPTLLIDNQYEDHSGLRMLKTLVNFCPNNKKKPSTFRTLNECTNECLLKTTGRTRLREYKVSDNEKVYLKNSKRDLVQEKRCYQNCVSSYCFIHSYLTVNGFAGLDIYAVVVESYKVSIFAFFIQFVSLIFLFTNTSVYYLLIKSSRAPVRLLCERFGNRRVVGKLLHHTKWLPLALCFISALSICSNILKVYLENLNAPVKSEVSNFSFLPETFSIVICVPVQLNLKRAIKLNLGKDETLFEKYSFAEIENFTNQDLEIVLKKVYLLKDKKRKIDFQRSEKVYFKGSHLASLNMFVFSRCFRLEFPPTETLMYRDLLITSELILKLDENCYYESSRFYEPVESLCQVYLLDDFKPFLSTTFQHQNVFQINRRRIEKTRSFLQKNCADYGEQHAGCTCRQSCIERCANRGYLDKYGNLSIQGTVIDRDSFEQSELSKIYFKEISDRNLIAACERQFVLDDCFNSFFEQSYRRLNEHSSRVIEINLDFENLEEDEFESSVPKLLIDFLNIIILFFGTNINVLIVYSASQISNRLKIKRKWMRLCMALCCTVGFLLHSVMVYLSIVKAPLVSSGYYDKPPLIFYPNLTFCFDYHTSNIDHNFQLTGSYLDELTSHLTPGLIFERIAFVDEKEDLIDLSFGLSADDQKPTHLNVMTYFTKAKKCFLLESNELTHKEYEFLNREDPYPLKIFFSKQAMNVDKIDLKSVLGNLHKNFVLQIAAKKSFLGKRKRKYQIKSEVLSIFQVDEFKSLSSLLGDDFQDSKAYLRRIAEHYRKNYNFATLERILKQELFGCEINDEMFGQFYEQRKDLFDNSYSDETSRKVFGSYVQLFEVNATDGEPDLEFSPVYYEKITRIENAEGIAKLLISLLNALSFWFNICILDFHRYFSKPFRLFTWLPVIPCRLLRKLEIRLKKKVNRYGNSRVSAPPNFFKLLKFSIKPTNHSTIN